MSIFSNEIKKSGVFENSLAKSAFENWIHTFLQVTRCTLSNCAEKNRKKELWKC